MGIADLFRPKYRHSDVRVRSEAVRALTADDAAIIEQVARTDRDIGVRRIAIEKIDAPGLLAQLGNAETERSLRELIQQRAAELWMSQACGDHAERASEALTGIVQLGDQHALVDVVVRASQPAIRKRAFGELRDPRALAQLAKSAAAQDLRTAAIARIDDGDVLRALAIDTTQKEVGLAAVDKLDDVDRLENVAHKAKNKAVRQRARKIVSEIAEAERAKRTPVVPDAVKRRRAERAQLLREVEALADTFDFATASDTFSAAEAAWLRLAGDDDDDHDERFHRAVERFWKRKELHDSQARTPDELRAVEREAARDKERAAAERAAGEAAQPPETELPADPAREAREAEAKARREEREQRRLEDEAKQAALAEERAARHKEDAERGLAIADSLEALCGEMEQLTTADPPDLRAIDRTLAQASKLFDGIGKVPAERRDPLADRYQQLRGKLVILANERREAEDWLRWSNVPKAEALIETAKQMAEAPATPDLGNRLRQLQALWKEEVGPMPQRRSKELWSTFKAACDQVYDKVKVGRAGEQEKFGEVTKAKEALIAEAEALSQSTEFAATAERLKALQASWKDSGHLPRKQGDALWKRFRAACDAFFERRKPMLDARHAEEGENLARKQALIARAQRVSDAAGEGTWGKAIGEIKDLQREWKEIGYVPRRDADAVYRAFRAACDSLFTKRDQARDAEANAHRAEVDALRAELDAVIAAPGPDPEVVARALAARTKARELGVLPTEVGTMVAHLVAHHATALAGTDLDPAALRAARDKLIARATELVPKQPTAVDAAVDVAAQLKQAMRANAFGDLRFSGRDPVEVVDELRASWTELGPILDDTGRDQAARFAQLVAQVLAAAGGGAGEPEPGERDSSRRRRRDRPAPQPPISTGPEAQVATVVATPSAMPEHSPITVVPDANASAVAAIETPDEIGAGSAVPISAHDAITQPARLPPEVPVGMPEQVVAASATIADEVMRPRSLSSMPPMDEVDTGWDLGDDDPTATAETDADAGDGDSPSAAELAGDGVVDGDDAVD